MSQPEETFSRPELALYSLKVAVIGTIFLDYVWLGHALNPQQLCGVFFLVVPSLLFDAYILISNKAY